MKRLLATISFSFWLCWSAHAQAICYGAWWTTGSTTPGALKEAGEVVITFQDVGNVAGIGNFTIEAKDGNESYHYWNWMWSQSQAYPARINFKSLAGLGQEQSTVWTGVYNRVTGQVTGTFRNKLFWGRFQATFQPVWDKKQGKAGPQLR